MVEASLIESYEDNEEEMIDVRPIVSLDEGSSSVPTNFNSDQMAVMNSLDINSMTSNSPGLQSGTFLFVLCKSRQILTTRKVRALNHRKLPNEREMTLKGFLPERNFPRSSLRNRSIF